MAEITNTRSEAAIHAARAEIEAGMALAKCRKCGCMADTLHELARFAVAIGASQAHQLADTISAARETMRPTQYACLGCDHCYPAVARNILTQAFPEVEAFRASECELRLESAGWPPVAGEYFVLDRNGSVAVTTLASVDLASELARRKPDGLAIVGKTETENIGLDKIIKNVVSSASIRYLIVAGKEPRGHLAGDALLALAANGTDEQGRVKGARGKRPVLRNVSADEVKAFRDQLQVLDMVGCESADAIVQRVEELSRSKPAACRCAYCTVVESGAPVQVVRATRASGAVKLDKAGYFVIVPLPDRGLISVEHYAYDNTLLRVIEGSDAKALYLTIVQNGWVTELSHAAYLGRELTKAELSLVNGERYIQDGA
ncbi:MAG: DUF4346 domain-containing protein [Anaerolineae bacterium]|nr:DUF4346 domain-containing protein [Candidatus Roseilinea sp.]MDW8449003.1 DUF4346 domain-containing protein [Anaerolineae bacterium]